MPKYFKWINKLEHMFRKKFIASSLLVLSLSLIFFYLFTENKKLKSEIEILSSRYKSVTDFNEGLSKVKTGMRAKEILKFVGFPDDIEYYEDFHGWIYKDPSDGTKLVIPMEKNGECLFPFYHYSPGFP